MPKCNIIVLHEYGAPSHYQALQYLIEEKYGNKIGIVFREFSIIYKIFKSIVKLDTELLKKQAINIYTLIYLLLTRNQIVVLGIAPYDYRLLFLSFLLRKHTVFYHTSWPYWDYSFYPKRFLANTSFIRKTWKKFIENKIKGIFCVTKPCYQSLIENYNIHVKSVIVSHAYDKKIYYCLDNYSRNFQKIRVIYVGRLINKKGINKILDLISQLPEDKFKFGFVGNGLLKNKLKVTSKKQNNVNYYGYISNQHLLAYHMRRSDIIILPSIKTGKWEELFGMVIIEAMACGLIVLSTDHCGPREIIKHGINGFIYGESSFVINAKEMLLKLYKEREYLLSMRENAIASSKYYMDINLSKQWDILLNEYLMV